MYDKTVRRRRAVLGLLVALSLILLTAYFGEPVGGGLHSVQRGFLEVVAPIQDGASRALKPFRDLFGWFGDTLDARGERDRLRKELQAVRRDAIANEDATRRAAELERLLGLPRETDLSAYRPVTGRVIVRPPTVWYSRITVNKGSSDGVRRQDPVVNGDGLVGHVSTVTPNAAVVTLITDHTSGVSAKITKTGVTGVVQPAVGAPTDLLLEYVRRGDQVRPRENVITAGIKSSRLDSLFPPGIPIGWVTRVDRESVGVYKTVHLRPFANLRNLNFVSILTRRDGGDRT